MDAEHRVSGQRVIVVGAGLSGLATALRAAEMGRQVTVFESSDLVGGAAAYSGGQVWVGANHVAAAEGITDDVELAESYVRSIAHRYPDLLDEDAMRRWLTTAPRAMRHWEDVGAVRWTLIRGLADYHADAPGALSDGRYLTVGALEPQFWRALVTALGLPDLEDEQFAPPERQRQMSDRLQAAFGRRSRDEWMAELEDLEACVGPVNGVAEAVVDPQVRHRGMVARAGSRDVGPGSPFRFDGEQVAAFAPAPRFGEHTAEVLATVGVGEDELADLRARGVV